MSFIPSFQTSCLLVICLFLILILAHLTYLRHEQLLILGRTLAAMPTADQEVFLEQISYLDQHWPQLSDRDCHEIITAILEGLYGQPRPARNSHSGDAQHSIPIL